MLNGKGVTLRPVREAGLDAVHAAHVDIEQRAFFPLGGVSESAFRGDFAEQGSGRSRRVSCSWWPPAVSYQTGGHPRGTLSPIRRGRS